MKRTQHDNNNNKKNEPEDKDKGITTIERDHDAIELGGILLPTMHSREGGGHC